MPPWPEWQFEYIGSRFLGRLLGLWSSLCVSLVRKLFRLVKGIPRNRRYTLNDAQPSRTEFSFVRRLSRMAISTLLTLGVWRIVTLKAVWLSAGKSGDRILTAILLFVSASWVISLVWICFSKSERNKIPAPAHSLRKPRYGSPHAKAS